MSGSGAFNSSAISNASRYLLTTGSIRIALRNDSAAPRHIPAREPNISECREDAGILRAVADAAEEQPCRLIDPALLPQDLSKDALQSGISGIVS